MILLNSRFFMMLEMSALFLYSLLGPSGLFSLQEAQKNNIVLLAELKTLQHENNHLKETIQDWHTYPFYKEQFIRERLQMAKKDEKLYYIQV